MGGPPNRFIYRGVVNTCKNLAERHQATSSREKKMRYLRKILKIAHCTFFYMFIDYYYNTFYDDYAGINHMYVLKFGRQIQILF